MIEKDTVRLLRECDAGVKMGVEAIAEVKSRVCDPAMKAYLSDCKKEHEKLGEKIEKALERFGDEGKEPNPIAEGMSKLKTELKLHLSPTDGTVAALMVDGCNMGVKSLSRYLNEYEAADEEAKGIAKELIRLEEELGKAMRAYL